MNFTLKVALWTAGINQREAARIAGIHETVLSRAIHGRLELSKEQQARIASAIGRRVEDIFPQRSTA